MADILLFPSTNMTTTLSHENNLLLLIMGKISSQGSVIIYFEINPATDSCIVMKGYSVFI